MLSCNGRQCYPITTDVRDALDGMAWLYTRDSQAVRLEVQRERGVIRLHVYGPLTKYEALDFPDEMSLLDHQATRERQLLADGYHLQATAERRASASGSSVGNDRRRSRRA